jgi:cobalamin-dependent methionine synthase I
MMKRLQIILSDEEYLEIEGVARKQRLTVAEWVHQELRKAKGGYSGTVEAKLRAIAKASQYEFLTADIDVILEEIESGYRLP